MGIDMTGSYRNVGESTLKALAAAAGSDKRIEAAEIDAIEKAAQADGVYSAGEKALIGKLREGTQGTDSIQDLHLAGIAATGAAQAQFNLEIEGSEAKASLNGLSPQDPAVKAFLAGIETAIRTDDSDSDDRIRELVKQPQKLAAAALANPDLLVRAIDILKSGNFSKEDLAAVVTIFRAVPGPQQAAILQKFVKDDDDDTIRELSRHRDALAAIAAARPETLSASVRVLKSGCYSEDDQKAVARVVAAQPATEQNRQVEALIANNGADDDNTLRELSQHRELLANISPANRLRSLDVLYTGSVSAGDRQAMRLIFASLGAGEISPEQAQRLAGSVGKLQDREKVQLAQRLEQLDRQQRQELFRSLVQEQDEKRQLTLLRIESTRISQAKAAESGKPQNIVDIAGFRQGDQLDVDGPGPVNGTGELKELSPAALQIRMEVATPAAYLGFNIQKMAEEAGLKVSGGKINVSVRLEKSGEAYQYMLIDHFNADHVVHSDSTQLAVSTSPDGKKQEITIPTSEGNIVISVDIGGKTPTASMNVPGMPSSFDIARH